MKLKLNQKRRWLNWMRHKTD